jgi:SAM-dependent methyltransferase
MTEGYQEDLAYIHDVGFGGFAQQSAPGLLEILRQKSINQGLVVDLGCGSGIWAKALTEANYEVLGIDLSEAMLNLARVKAPKATFQKTSFLQFNFPRCNAVTSIGECLNYQFDEHEFTGLQELLSRIYEALSPGGVFIFDIAQPGYVKGSNPQQSYCEGKDWAILLTKEEDRTTHQLTRKMTIFRQIGNCYRRSEEIHCVNLYQSSVIAKELRKIGFRVRITRGYGEFRFTRAQVGFIAAKV